MRHESGDIFAWWERHPTGWVAITTNGDVNRAGRAVMGRGVAKLAADRWPLLPVNLAQRLEGGNFVYPFPEIRAFSFPVKHHWHERADLDLIRRSAVELASHARRLGLTAVALPRPGCGNGGLRWCDVEPTLAKYLDDTFVVVDHASDEGGGRR